MHVGQRNLVGIQWRPSDQAELADDVWFYQAADRDIIRELIVNDVFPDTQPYHDDQPLSRNNEYIESILPDGSYFGIGTTGRNALRTLNPVLATWIIRSKTSTSDLRIIFHLCLQTQEGGCTI
ncbi:MAG: hypothetical protein NVSMB27_17680 [Ktedonobacteraceae bacterium]